MLLMYLSWWGGGGGYVKQAVLTEGKAPSEPFSLWDIQVVVIRDRCVGGLTYFRDSKYPGKQNSHV